MAVDIGDALGEDREDRRKIDYAYFDAWTQAVDHAVQVDQAVLNGIAAKVEHTSVKFGIDVRHVVRERIAALNSGKAGL